MVKNRTFVFITLAMLVWLSVATGSLAYYYLEQMRYQNQLNEKQQLLIGLSEDYDVSITKRNMLSGEYGMLLGEYQWFSNANYSSLMDKYQPLFSHLGANYTSTFNQFPELNITYENLLSKLQTISRQTQVTKEEFGLLLDDFYKLFMDLAMKETEGSLEKISTIGVNLCIDYGNQTVEWHNVSAPLGMTLFDLTKREAEVNYSYWETMEPGHILISAINGYVDGYWAWYYWDETTNGWIFGPVGCDAWILESNGLYKWVCIRY